MKLRFGGARHSAMTAIGCGLDGIGELDGVGLPRSDGETDRDYRERLIVKLDWLCGVGRPVDIDIADFGRYRVWLEQSTPVEADGLQYLVQSVSFEDGRAGAWLMPTVPLQLVEPAWLDIKTATGEWLDQWSNHTHTAPPDDTKPRQNHVRDAVEANRQQPAD